MIHALAAMCAALVFGCAEDDSTQIQVPDLGTVSRAEPEQPAVPVGVGEVNGLPGTPLEVSPNGIPIIEGVERPDYADTGINSFANRLARVAPDNPTGEYRFLIDELGPDEGVIDDDRAGFRSGLEEYTWRLTHPNVTHEKAFWLSAIFHGKAFNRNADGSPNALGACWLAENAGQDCEFPSSKAWKWRLAWGNEPGDEYSTCNVQPPSGTFPPTFFQDPGHWIQEAFDGWGSNITMTHTLSHTENLTIFCEPMPGSPFGAILGRSGSYGNLTRRVTNAKDAYPGACHLAHTPAAFPKGLYTYSLAQMSYSADNMWQRSLLCNGNQNDPDMLHTPAVNMFMHELGHVLGFAHFSSGVMATGGNCDLFFHQTNSVPQVFKDVLGIYTPTSGTFKFINGHTCADDSDSTLPAPLPNSQQFPFGRLYQ
jgi:hypothetical protein